MIDTKDFAGVPEDFEVSPEIGSLDAVEGVQAFINSLSAKDSEIRNFSVKFSVELGGRLEKIGNRAKRPLPLLLLDELRERIFHSKNYLLRSGKIMEINTERSPFPPKFYNVAQVVALMSMRYFGLRDDIYTEYNPVEIEDTKEIFTMRRYKSQKIPRLEFIRNLYIDPGINKVTYLSWVAEEVKTERKVLGFKIYL